MSVHSGSLGSVLHAAPGPVLFGDTFCPQPGIGRLISRRALACRFRGDAPRSLPLRVSMWAARTVVVRAGFAGHKPGSTQMSTTDQTTPRAVHRRGPRKWGLDVIERELRAVAGELGHWPTASELKQTQREALLKAVYRSGGLREWAVRLGFDLPRGQRGAVWNDQRIERSLRSLMAGRTTWPTQREFKDAGLTDLHQAVRRHGGTAVWAERLGVEAPSPRRPRAGQRDRQIETR